MKPWRQWNAPLGLFQVLVFGLSLTAFTFTWIVLVVPYLSSLLAAKKSFAESHPFLYDVIHTAIAVMLMPLMVGFVFVYCYLYQRRYDRNIQGPPTPAA
jgi:hypothetical protein